jgi:adenosylmethionine-8-amino-7-oxononanoate aminotransferase
MLEMVSVEKLAEIDRERVWHPYAPMPGQVPPLPVVSASGVRLRLASGEELVDGMSSWWAAIHGYAHPRLDAAARDQLGRMSHVMFGGLTHEPAVRLCQRLASLAPDGLEHVFLCDSGSVSVEVAIKMCLQYWRSTGQPGKRRLLTWRGGYHGDTFMAMSVCDPEGGMHRIWDGVLPRQVFAGLPPAGFSAGVEPGYAETLAGLIKEHAHELAAVIVEPVVQGAGGMRFHDPGYLRVLREACDSHGVLLVFDEIATGFGRTGALFAAEHAGVSPDVMCVGKALTGGYLTLAATLCSPRVAAGISQGELPVLAHGPTFMGNPLACAVANASLDVLLGTAGDEPAAGGAGGASAPDSAGGASAPDSADGVGDPDSAGGRDARGRPGGQLTYPDGWRVEVGRIETGLRAGLAPVAGLPAVTDVRVLGAIGVVQVDHEVDLAAATAAAVRAGVWLRPFRDLIYTMPPYVTGDDDLALICAAVYEAARC